VAMTSDVSEGITRVLAGDAHGAIPIFQRAAEASRRLSGILPEYERLAVGYQAEAYLVSARASLNAGDMASASLLLARANTEYERLLPLLDAANPQDLPTVVEVHGQRLEGAILFSAYSLFALDLDDAMKRLDAVKNDRDKLEQLSLRVGIGPLTSLWRLLPMLHSILTRFCELEELIIFQRSPASKRRFEDFRALGQQLFDAASLAKGAGDRGGSYVHAIEHLTRLRRHLQEADRGRIKEDDFGKFGGLLAFASFVVLTAGFAITGRISPTNSMLALILSLVV